MLDMPNNAERKDLAAASLAFLSGGDPVNSRTRVIGDPIVGTMRDYPHLMTHLFAEHTAVALQYLADAGNEGLVGPSPVTTLIRVKRIWEEIFTSRELLMADHTINVQVKGGSTRYPASHMSDGERAGFYLIGEVLLADKDLLVIDEPELHVHESIQAVLWDALQLARPDCTFVYLTHDLTFAATRVGAPKVVLYNYVPDSGSGGWVWDLIPPDTGLPEDVVLRIAGSRRPTIFTEGLRGSLDEEVFEAVYPDFHIVPSQSCETVIRSVRAFRTHGGLHRYDVHGIIDRDDRAEDEIARLREVGVYPLPVAGVENLLILPEVLGSVADHLHLIGPDRIKRVTEAKRRVVEHLRGRREDTIAQRAQYNVERCLNRITREGTTRQAVVAAVEQAVAVADPGGAYDQAAALIDSALNAAGDEAYNRTLTVYRNKGLIPAVAQAFGLNPDDYRRIALGLLRAAEHPLREMLRHRLPSL
jgi:hypothetical protein